MPGPLSAAVKAIYGLPQKRSPLPGCMINGSGGSVSARSAWPPLPLAAMLITRALLETSSAEPAPSLRKKTARSSDTSAVPASFALKNAVKSNPPLPAYPPGTRPSNAMAPSFSRGFVIQMFMTEPPLLTFINWSFSRGKRSSPENVFIGFEASTCKETATVSPTPTSAGSCPMRAVAALAEYGADKNKSKMILYFFILPRPVEHEYGEVDKINLIVAVEVRLDAGAGERFVIPVRHDRKVDEVYFVVAIEVAALAARCRQLGFILRADAEYGRCSKGANGVLHGGFRLGGVRAELQRRSVKSVNVAPSRVGARLQKQFRLRVDHDNHGAARRARPEDGEVVAAAHFRLIYINGRRDKNTGHVGVGVRC